MKWYHYVICFVLIMMVVFCTMELVKLFNVKSAEYGTIITIETKNDYTEVSRFDYGSLSFDTEDYVNFTNVATFPPADFNGKENNYTIIVNGNPANNIVINAGKISGDFTQTFYDLNGDIATVSDLHILIEYYASGTKVTLTIQNNNDSVSYLTTYTNINGAVIKVVQRG